jgi:antitoxin (DNA-binding transcriptional repressor) of toxin-antitoxin stability system
MKTANIADLRNNFRVIAAWISDGESVEIRKRGHDLLANPADVRPNDL